MWAHYVSQGIQLVSLVSQGLMQAKLAVGCHRTLIYLNWPNKYKYLVNASVGIMSVTTVTNIQLTWLRQHAG